jgi:serine/threonine-protein kinase RsbT
MEWATRLDFTVVVRTKFVTAASELGRNALVHGRGGTMVINELLQDGRNALQLIFEDQGPGIANIEQAMRDGYTTANSLGLGLGGARRLVNEFSLESEPGRGTKVTVTQWKKR